MDLKQLFYFKTIVEEGSILSASKKLFMSQPPLSNQIKLLEEELNCLLFERGSRKITLTDEGKLLYQKSLSILSLSEIAKKEIHDLKDENTGTIRIGLVSSIGSYIIKNYLSSFLNEYKNIKLDIYEANTYQLIEKLNANLIDLAIVRTPFEKSILKVIPIKEEKLIAIGNKSFFKEELSIKELCDLPIITYRRWYEIINQYLLIRNKEIKNYLCINDDARTTLEFVNESIGVGIVPESAILKNNLEKDIIKKEIKDFNIYTNISLIYNEKSYISNIMRKFITHVTMF